MNRLTYFLTLMLALHAFNSGLHAANTWTLGGSDGKQCLLTPDGKPFMMIGISHVGGALQSTKRQDRPQRLIEIEAQLRGWYFTVPQAELWDRFPYIVPLDRLVGDQTNRFEDVFDPAFKERLRRKIEAACRASKNNPNCIGYWWTDIPPWPLSSKKKFGKHWVDYIRELPESAAGRQRYEAFLNELGPHEDVDFLRLIARELYTDSAKYFEQYDPQRLIFGERYDTFNVPREVLEEAAKVIDVLSVQPYEGKFNDAKYEEWHRLTGKPMVISDWNLSFPTGEHSITMWPQFKTPHEAAEAYEAYLNKAFAKPYILGYFKCQYVDNVLPTGMLKQGLLKNPSGNPYEVFPEAIQSIHERLVDRFVREGRLTTMMPSNDTAVDTKNTSPRPSPPAPPATASPPRRNDRARGEGTEIGGKVDSHGLGLFHDYIEPLLKQHCYACHSHDAKKAKGGLVLDSRNGWLKGGDSGAAIVPGKPDESILFQAISYDGYEMPPTQKLDDELVALVRQWIEFGAPDPRTGPEIDGATIQVAAGPKKEDLWSIKPMIDAVPPQVNSEEWSSSDVDRFLFSAMDERGLSPSQEAPAHTLLRRLHDILTGLPPTPSEVLDFLEAAKLDFDKAYASKVEDPSFWRALGTTLVRCCSLRRRQWFDRADALPGSMALSRLRL